LPIILALVIYRSYFIYCFPKSAARLPVSSSNFNPVTTPSLEMWCVSRCSRPDCKACGYYFRRKCSASLDVPVQTDANFSNQAKPKSHASD